MELSWDPKAIVNMTDSLIHTSIVFPATQTKMSIHLASERALEDDGCDFYITVVHFQTEDWDGKNGLAVTMEDVPENVLGLGSGVPGVELEDGLKQDDGSCGSRDVIGVLEEKPRHRLGDRTSESGDITIGSGDVSCTTPGDGMSGAGDNTIGPDNGLVKGSIKTDGSRGSVDGSGIRIYGSQDKPGQRLGDGRSGSGDITGGSGVGSCTTENGSDGSGGVKDGPGDGTSGLGAGYNTSGSGSERYGLGDKRGNFEDGLGGSSNGLCGLGNGTVLNFPGNGARFNS